MKVHSVTWFNVKSSPSIENGSMHFLKFIIFSKFLPLYHQNIVYNVLKRNAYFSHSDNILLTILCDEDIEVRRKGLEIYQITGEDIKEVRQFELPNTNTDAFSIFEIADLVIFESICKLYNFEMYLTFILSTA